MTRFLRITFLLALGAVLFSTVGCATKRTVLPKISVSPRTSLQVETPVLVSVLDARTQKDEDKDVVRTLKEGLSEAYGNSIEWTDYFTKVPDGRTAVKIHLKANEANFGSRIVSATSVSNSFTTARAQASDGWGSVVATASAEQTTLGSAFAAEGWWIGTSWLNLEIVDKRSSQVERLSIPLVAETKKSNTWGYRSGDAAANEAWSQVGQQLIQVMDKVLVTVRNQEK